jgi:hypothetical protein
VARHSSKFKTLPNTETNLKHITLSIHSALTCLFGYVSMQNQNNSNSMARARERTIFSNIYISYFEEFTHTFIYKANVLYYQPLKKVLQCLILNLCTNQVLKHFWMKENMRKPRYEQNVIS